MPSKLICQAGSNFKSQNVEYLAFIEGAPHMNRQSKKVTGIFEGYFAASYDSLLARKHNNIPSKLICGAGPSFKSQNVEYVAFIDRDPHISGIWKL